MQSGSRLDWALFFLLGLCWGSSYLFIKIGVESLPPLTLVAGRLLIGALLLAVVVLLAGDRLPRDRRTYGHLTVIALVNIVIPFALITWAEQSVDSALASILNATVPLFTIGFAAAFLHDEPVTVNRAIGLVVGFAGVVLLTSRTLAPGGASHANQVAGEIALIGAAASYAVGNVYARRNVHLRPAVTAFFQVALALVIVAVLAIALERPWTVAPRPDAILAVLWLGLLGSGVAYLLFFRLLARWGSTRSSLVAYLLPVVGIVLGVVVLHEQVDGRVLAGTALIIGGVALVNSRFGSRRLFGRSRLRADGLPEIGLGPRRARGDRG